MKRDPRMRTPNVSPTGTGAVWDDEHRQVLSPQAAQVFSDALAQPARVNERLAAALDRPRRFRWVD